MQMLRRFCTALGHASLGPVIYSYRQAGGATASVGHAVAIVSAVAAEQRGSLSGSEFSDALVKATPLLALCCYKVSRQQYDEAARSSASGSLAGSQAELNAAAFHVAGLLPQLAAAFASLAGSPADTTSQAVEERLSDMNSNCTNLRNPLELLLSAQLDTADPGQLSVWSAAAAAGLRLLPCLTQLHTQLEQLSSPREGVTAVVTSILLLCLEKVPRQLHQLLEWEAQPQPGSMHSSHQGAQPAGQHQAANQTAAWVSLQAQLWALHTTMCRLVAALTAPANPLRLPGLKLEPPGWLGILYDLNATLAAFAGCQKLLRANTMSAVTQAPQ